jgi:polyisoprenoid-binding protein YceI
MTATALLDSGSWVLDPARTAVSFSGRANPLAPMFRASFASVSGVVQMAGSAQLSVDVDVRSITTGNRTWDELLRRLDPFDATRCPVATYRGSADVAVGERVHVDGDLELRGVLRQVRLSAHVRPRGDEIVMTATGEVDRRHFGVRCDLPAVGRFVPAVMRLQIEATAVQPVQVPRQR